MMEIQDIQAVLFSQEQIILVLNSKLIIFYIMLYYEKKIPGQLEKLSGCYVYNGKYG